MRAPGLPEVRGNPILRQLTIDRFTRKQNITQPEATFTPILDVEVPRGETWFFDERQEFEMALGAYQEFTAAATGTESYDVSSAIADLPHIPDYEDVAVYDVTAGQYLTISSVNYYNAPSNANRVTVSDAVDGNTVRVYSSPLVGSVRMVLSAPGIGELRYPIFTRSMRMVHLGDQANSRSKLLLNPAVIRANMAGEPEGFAGHIAPSHYRVQVMYRGAVTIPTDAAALANASNNGIAYLDLPYRVVPSSQVDPRIPAMVRRVLADGGR